MSTQHQCGSHFCDLSLSVCAKVLFQCRSKVTLGSDSEEIETVNISTTQSVRGSMLTSDVISWSGSELALGLELALVIAKPAVPCYSSSLSDWTTFLVFTNNIISLDEVLYQT